MLSAKEARELSGPSADDYLVEIEKLIKAAAVDKKREVLIRSEPYAYWLYRREDLGEEPRKAIEALKKAGYTVDFHYQENQFVDMALVIRW